MGVGSTTLLPRTLSVKSATNDHRGGVFRLLVPLLHYNSHYRWPLILSSSVFRVLSRSPRITILCKLERVPYNNGIGKTAKTNLDAYVEEKRRVDIVYKQKMRRGGNGSSAIYKSFSVYCCR